MVFKLRVHLQTDQSVPGRKIILTPLNNTSKFRLVPYKFRTKKFPRITITGTAEDFFRHTVDLIPIEADGCQQNRRILVACGSYADLIQVEKLVEMLNERYSIKYCDLEKFFKFVSKNVGKVDTTVNSLNLTNGIKFLQAKGFICPDDLESLISRYVNNVTDKDLIDLYLPLTIESKQLYKFELVRSSKLLHRYLEYDTNYRDECRRRFAGGIYISSYDTFQPSLKYRIYLPNANLAWNTGITYSGTDLPDIPIPGSPNQWSSGLLTLQYAVEDSFIKDVFIRNSYPITNKSPSFIPNFILKLQRFPKLHTGDRELAEAVSAFRLFWPWFVILPVIHCVSVITSERESGMLTYLETVGIYRSMYYTVNGVTMFLKLILAQMIGIVFWFHRFRNSEKKDSNFNLEYYHYTKPATNMEIYDNLLDPAEIEVDFLIKNYGHVQAVYIRSFKAYVGQITVLLGPNQAGKSTILSMLNGTIRPTAGTIKICGEFLDIRTTAACQDYISYCPPNNPHFRSMTVCEHIKFFKYLKPRSDTSIHELMEQFGIIDMANKSVDSLSNEARRKLCLAIAFANCCKIVLVDEPTAGMENADKEMVYKLLNEFKHEK
uniref:ABC transporter domain-containing protein n=1 Tax=Syphacia muris TaxID=451379 RepID=A0A158R5G9_9BILA